jgi:hypothetical protein
MQWAPNQDLLRFCRDAEGIAGPIPGALGNRDLVVVVGVAPVNLAGLKSVGLAHAFGGVALMARDVRVG